MSLRQCARYIGIPYATLGSYWLYLQDEIPYIVVGSAKLVDPEVMRACLLKEGYKFSSTTKRCIDGYDSYDSQQRAWAGSQNGNKVDAHSAGGNVAYGRQIIWEDSQNGNKVDLHSNESNVSHGQQEQGAEDNEQEKGDCPDEDDSYSDPQTMLADIENGKLCEDVE